MAWIMPAIVAVGKAVGAGLGAIGTFLGGAAPATGAGLGPAGGALSTQLAAAIGPEAALAVTGSTPAIGVTSGTGAIAPSLAASSAPSAIASGVGGTAISGASGAGASAGSTGLINQVGAFLGTDLGSSLFDTALALGVTGATGGFDSPQVPTPVQPEAVYKEGLAAREARIRNLSERRTIGSTRLVERGGRPLRLGSSGVIGSFT
jgi:hypothetical protein